jgi:hypothetical protein
MAMHMDGRRRRGGRGGAAAALVVKAERKIANDGFNATAVDGQLQVPGLARSSSSARGNTIATCTSWPRGTAIASYSEGVVRYNPSGDGPDSSWVLLARAHAAAARASPWAAASMPADANEGDE